ncbi:hypothetical protein, partial [Escherichia coli]|uniref:hypothetical protein n=1 Tax=Escherichia coli TaxID=562 RepID=UPI0019D612E0
SPAGALPGRAVALADVLPAAAAERWRERVDERLERERGRGKETDSVMEIGWRGPQARNRMSNGIGGRPLSHA